MFRKHLIVREELKDLLKDLARQRKRLFVPFTEEVIISGLKVKKLLPKNWEKRKKGATHEDGQLVG